MKESEIKKLRAEFFKDIHELLQLHKEFCRDSEGCDPDCDNWDLVLDYCQNFFVKWIIEYKSQNKE